MRHLDKHYLSLQFRNLIHSKDAAEFQSFFENIMEKAFLDFKRIRPYGNEGDGGNDGYRKALGIYYQVYAPRIPKISEKAAAEKLQRDFLKLKSEWEGISNIKEYYFVFNDKYDGSIQMLEGEITKLQMDNPNIKFELFLAKDLESVFFQLNESDFIDLGFNVDQRQAVSNAYTYLESIKTEFDKENVAFARKLLENAKDIIFALDDENLSLEYEILECRYLQKSEKIDGAKAKYENVSKKYPKDPRPLLYLAEIYLNDSDFDKNKELLEKAQIIDGDYWLLKLELVLRQSYLREPIKRDDIDEKKFPDDPYIKASFYRVYGLILEDLGDQQGADSYIERAIHLNPDRFSNHVAKLTLIEVRMLSTQDDSKRLQLSQDLVKATEKVEGKFLKNGEVGTRNRAILNSNKLIAFLVQENIPSFENLSKETFELLLNCYFDKQIERILIGVLQYASLPDNDLNRLLEYLKSSTNDLSDDLIKVLIYQFNFSNKLFTDGKLFLKEIDSRKYLGLISDLENNDDQKVLAFLRQDTGFAITFANTLNGNPDLRRKIIEELPDNGNIQKEKLLLLLNTDEEDYDQAFQILQQLDISNLSYVECKPMLRIAQQKKAWDFEILILEKLLEKEKAEKGIFNLKLELFTANFNLKKFPETISIGEDLLRENSDKNFLDLRNKEALLVNTVIACFERGKVDEEAFKKAKSIIKKYPLKSPSFEYKAGIEAEVYLNNNEPELALQSIVEGVKTRKTLSSQEYVKLYFLLSVKIGNQLPMSLDSLDRVTDNTFVKLSNSNNWYFIGNENELDAIGISATNNRYKSFIDKMIDDVVAFEGKYSSRSHEERIEFIFSIEKYILWQAVQTFQKLGGEGNLEGIDMIEIPKMGDTIDPQYLLKFMEDLHKRTEPLFDLYIKNNVPLAMLAVSEGGLVGAIGRIQNEGRGFINFSVGTPDEREKQVEVAKKVVDKGMQFYIDGTSALVLSEIGLLQKIYKFLPNLKVPQSVINMLAEIAARFSYVPGQTGNTMGYSKGKITFSSIGQDKRELLQANFRSDIKLLESNPKNIDVISSANKVDCFSEMEVPDELSDACILAQKSSIPVLTEDYLYLKINELETKKKPPEYFSSWALVRVLYEKGHITFDEYLDYFGYLSSYRFRFLSVTPDDIQKAVFGDKDIKRVEPKNIKRLNFPLVLSEEYGVSIDAAIRVIAIFFFRVMMNDTVELDITDEIFTEIIESFPVKTSKKEFGERLLGICIGAFENNTPERLCRLEDKLKYQKVGRLLQTVEALSSEAKIVTTNE